MKQTGFRRILCIVVLILLLLPALLIPVSADNRVSLDNSPVETDLETLISKEEKDKLILDETVRTDDGAQFVSVVSVLEHGFDARAEDWGYYGLYIYVYNPSGKPLLSSSRNKVEMQVSSHGGARTAVTKYPLRLCSYSSDYVLYKYKVSGITLGLLEQMEPVERGYFISGIEFLFSGQSNPKDFDVSGSYYFTGFNAGFDSVRSGNDTLRLRYDKLETISVELHPTSWMSQTSDKGEGYKYEVSGVYFAIPNYYLKTFGNWDGDELRGLYAVEGSYYENKINGIVTDNAEVYNNAKQVAGKNIKWYGYSASDYADRMGVTYREDFPLAFFKDKIVLSDGTQTYAEYSYNYRIGRHEVNSGSIFETYEDFHSDRVIYKICIPFYSETADMISKETVMQALAEYSGDDYRMGTADADRTAGYRTYKVTAKDPPMGFTSLDYSQEHPFWTWWDRFRLSADAKDEKASIEWLQRVDLAALEAAGLTETKDVANKYYIGESDVAGLRKLHNSNAIQNSLLNGFKGSTVYLMHFAKTDFYAESVYVDFKGGGYGNIAEGHHYYYERTAFEDFDILQFTFRDQNDKMTVVPVIASPVNVVGGLPAPNNPNGNPSNPGIDDPGVKEFLSGCGRTFGSLNSWGKFFALILGLLLLTVLVMFAKPVFSVLGGFFGGIFRGIGGVARGIGGAVQGGAKAVGTVFNAKEKVYDAKRKRAEDRQSDADRERKQKNEDTDRATAATDRERKQKNEDADRATAAADRNRKQQYEDEDRKIADEDRKRRQAREDVDNAHRDALHKEKLHHERVRTTQDNDFMKGRSLDHSQEKDD